MTITKCRWCDGENLKFRERQDTPHYGEMYCGHCNKHCFWVANPLSQKNDSIRVGKKTIQEVCSFHRLKEESCFFCRRTKKQLGFNETLTVDHIDELDKGGEDKLWNMQVLCSACHKLKNWCRLYMNWHFKKEDDK